MDEFGYVQKFPELNSAKMRDALSKAIALKPTFTESYELMAFVNLVNNERLEDSVNLMKQALKYQPGSQRYSIRHAELLFRLNKLDEAAAIAEKLVRTADGNEIKTRGESLLQRIGQKKEYDRMVAERIAQANASGGNMNLSPTGETIAVEDPDANLRSINQALRKLGSRANSGYWRPCKRSIAEPCRFFTRSSPARKPLCSKHRIFSL